MCPFLECYKTVYMPLKLVFISERRQRHLYVFHSSVRMLTVACNFWFLLDNGRRLTTKSVPTLFLTLIGGHRSLWCSPDKRNFKVSFICRLSQKFCVSPRSLSIQTSSSFLWLRYGDTAPYLIYSCIASVRLKLYDRCLSGLISLSSKGRVKSWYSIYIECVITPCMRITTISRLVVYSFVAVLCLRCVLKWMC